ncbi:lycopene cyclase family protein [Streptomyces sp. NBRC 109706]|uniref:lycopene cyclase family protein n=1 Tax=Streptomyces sp. NBRC 109706 TaxID=1550035 RepID=UPI0007816884|nr:lycopene cyclase family protein [Streptomyces sp. NBRC 109706]
MCTPLCPDVGIAVVGAGAAGLSLALRLAAAPLPPGSPQVTLIDAPPGPHRPPPRTWCYWEPPGGEFDELLTASWARLRVFGPDGVPVERRPSTLRYKMLRSTDLQAAVRARLGPVRARELTVTAIRPLPRGAELRAETATGERVGLRARWVFDSRPPAPPPARTRLLQHFHGWFLRTARPAFDPTVVDLMDFRVPQPPGGLAFGYVLPLAPDEALVEYTEFSAAALDDAAYDRALGHYAATVRRLGAFRVLATERGAIPMTDARHPRQLAPAVFRLGAAGGATRPATGYTFAAAQRQTRAVARALAGGRRPRPPAAYPARALAMDAVLLRALDRGRVDGAAFLTRLFREIPPDRLLRFLDGDTRLHEDLAIGLHTPVPPMLRTAAELPWRRRRPVPPAGVR